MKIQLQNFVEAKEQRITAIEDLIARLKAETARQADILAKLRSEQ